MRSIYPKHIDRRRGLQTDTGHSRRWRDKLAGFAFGLLLVLIIALLSGCGGGDDADSSSKPLFSKWTSTVTGVVFDFTLGVYGPQDFRYYTAPNNGCDCTLEILGNNESGTAYLTSCEHFGPTDVCGPGGTLYNYTNQNAVLSLCDGGCEEYR
jgi:hypothetical protein